MDKTVTDYAIKKATGKTWNEWFHLLDKEQSIPTSPKEISHILHSSYNLAAWWSGMIASSYEQMKGIKEKHKNHTGYQLCITKVYTVSLPQLFGAWLSEKERDEWFGEGFPDVTSVATNTYLHIIWVDGKTRVSIVFSEKTKGKSQLIVDHYNLSSPEEAQSMKLFWKQKLDALSLFLKK